MARIRGMGGWWVIGGDPALLAPLPSPPGVIQHNAEYSVLTIEEVKQSKTTNGRGWTEALPVVRRVESATFRVAEDDVSFPEVIGLVEGAELPAVYLKRGALDQYDRIVRPIVESVRKDNDQKKARWVEVILKHGAYERQVTPPILPEPPGFGDGGDF